MIFSYFTNLASSAMICRKSDFQRLVSSPHVAKLIADYRAGVPNAKKSLPAFAFHASFPHGKRKASEALASGLFIGDYDHATAEELKKLIEAAVPTEEERDKSPILLVHITPSGKGLRVVAKATKSGGFAHCRSIADYQRALARKLGAERLMDEVVSDLSRLSFVPQASDILYLSDRLFDEAPEVTEFDKSVPAMPRAETAPNGMPLFAESSQNQYEGVPLADIFKEYLQQTGGMPHEGARNSRYYSAARDLRYICDFNPHVVARHLPDVGLGESEVYQLCVSACQSSRATAVPNIVLQAVEAVRHREEIAEEEEVEESQHDGSQFAYFPKIAKDLVEGSPADFREATLLSLLPIVGTLSTHVRARYLDDELHSPSFFTAVSSQQASGKSFARRLVSLLLSTILEEDAKEREVEAQYKEKLRAQKNAKQQPQQPRIKVRVVPASISIAKLLQRLDYAEGEHLFSFAEEMDTLIKSNSAGSWSQKNDLYRNAFDNATYGQDYLSDSSYSANLKVFYNLLVLGTPRQTERFFQDVENGMLSRCCFALIPDQFGAEMPKFSPVSNELRSRIASYVKTLRQAKGEVNLSFLHPVLEGWLNKQRVQALEENNRALDILRRRSAVIGFRAALAFSPLYNLANKKHQNLLSSFALHIATLTLRNQMQFAGDRLNAICNGADVGTRFNTKSKSIYSSLGDIFTTADVEDIMRKKGMRSPARQLIYLWAKCELITKIEKNHYNKKIHGVSNRADKTN